MDNVIYPRSFWDVLKLLPEDMQPHIIWAIRDYAYDDIMPTTLTNIEQGFFVAFKPYFDSRRAKAENKGLTNGRRGGQLGNTNASKGNRIENEKTNGKTNETNGKTNKNECDHSFCTNTDTDMVDTNMINTDEEEDTNSGLAASSSSSSSSLKESFSPSAFILKFWNSVGRQYPYLKKIEYISTALEQKIAAGYEFALTCCDNDVNRAKNMLAKAVVNMAQSNFFEKNQGKATLTWLFASTENLEKCANGQYNDY